MQPLSNVGSGLRIAAVACVVGGCVHDLPVQTGPTAAGGAAPLPRIIVEDRPYWTEGFDAAYRVALRNVHPANRFHRTRHARAAPAIHGVHLWDSAFLSHIWRTWDVATAQEINRAVLDHARDGRIPHFSHRFMRSDLTQPPVIAWSMWENFLWSSDTAYLAAAYPVLQAYDAWLDEHRRLPSGLYFWYAPFESGKDNSPRFDDSTRRKQRDLRGTAAVDLSSYVALQSEVLARIAGVLGERGEQQRFEAKAADVRDLVNSLLWDEDAGFYFDRDEATGELLRVRSAASFLPLFAAVPDAARARRLRDHLMDRRSFGSLIPIPTVALDDPSYSTDMWRGPVWINVSYMIIRGLDAYGFHDDAAALAFATVDGVFRTHERTGGIWEFYDPERFDISRLQRKRGEVIKRITLGNKPLPDYGWTALVNTLVVEYLVGYRRGGEEQWLEPRLPPVAAGLRLEFVLPGAGLAIRMEALGEGRVRGEVVSRGERSGFLLAFGETLLLPAPASLRLAARAADDD